ncbi:hypothetical protein N7509_006547 [Penicillium cosmopolitanum]|uniref:Uncharacterized protein n=1 Tax=Penicillium cosmopolitanum TaxID=1131564 RepID=A0A9X0B7J5_9EURO|nr:uncharacterized protein N7509_006547 [Penicillium cosmopolitanum]KAJ5391057.1 hypothetical protein N7509_006547 [Penicillium cosmopolitanum]
MYLHLSGNEAVYVGERLCSQSAATGILILAHSKVDRRDRFRQKPQKPPSVAEDRDISEPATAIADVDDWTRTLCSSSIHL